MDEAPFDRARRLKQSMLMKRQAKKHDKGDGPMSYLRNFRNKGNGIIVIKHLIEEAKKLKIKRISIETGAGKFFIPARKLFKKCNFEPCKPFAHYKEDANSCYMSMLISN